MAVELDQHFMIDEKLLDEIASYATSWDTVVEIGCGQGALTTRLAKNAKFVFAIEKDESFISVLQDKFMDVKNVAFTFADVLDMELPEFDKCISNLPYAICEPLLWRLFRLKFQEAVLVLPEGFADILTGKTWSKLNFIVPMFFSVKKVKTIGKEAFNPPPRVRSALVVLKPCESVNPLREIYQQYDKKLRNALREVFMKEGLTKRKASLKASGMFQKQMLDKKVLNLSAVEIKKLMEKF
jgi:16S rRNA (adenine1518-N6/adenine1519-N6)-dimethyltransferase